MKNALLFLSALSTLILSLELHAFTFNNSVAAAFSEEKVPIRVSSTPCEELGMTNAELEDLLREAVDQYWNRAPTSNLYMDLGAPIATSSKFRTDDPCIGTSGCEPNPDLIVDSGIVVACNVNTDIFSNLRILAVTLTNNIQGRRLVGSLILINDRENNRFAQMERDEKVAVLAHEIGHAIGLGHSPVRDSLMYFTTVPKRRSLGQDDIDGISFLYPDSFSSSACGTLALNPQRPQGPKKKDQQSPLLLFIGLSLILLFVSRVQYEPLVKNETLKN